MRNACCAVVLLAITTLARADEVDDYINKQMKDRNIPGLALGVIKDGKLVKSQGYGQANLKQKTPVKTDTPFQLASVTKQFVAAGVMMLVEDGKLAVDDPINKYLKDVPGAWKGVTLRHLLTHTSGIQEYLSSEDAKKWTPQADPTLAKLVRKMRSEFEPGERYKYSNTNYVLLGHLIEKGSGKPYDKFLIDRAFKPLGMSATKRRVPGDRSLATGYLQPEKKGDGWKEASYLPPLLWDNGDGGLVSTVEDLAKWDTALSAGKVLKKESLEAINTRVKLNNGKVWDYGFGVVINFWGEHRIIGHGGGRPGAAVNFTRWPDDKVTVIVLCNVSLPDGNDAYQIARGAAKLFGPGVP